MDGRTDHWNLLENLRSPRGEKSQEPRLPLRPYENVQDLSVFGTEGGAPDSAKTLRDIPPLDLLWLHPPPSHPAVSANSSCPGSVSALTLISHL